MQLRITVTRSLDYGNSARQTLDIYRPRAAAGAPVVAFFYGGGWRSGRKGLYSYVGKALARRGYVAVVPDYRIYPEARYPAFLEDGARAVRWVKDNAGRYGGNPAQLFVMGHSAGAHIAAMLAVDDRWLSEVGLAPGRDIRGLIGIAGPYDFLPLRDEIYKAIFAGADLPQTQPIHHVAPGAPPALLLTGNRDRVVAPGNSSRFAARLVAAGNTAKVVGYPRVGHFLIVGAFAPLVRLLVPTLRDAVDFMTLQQSAPPNAPNPAAPSRSPARR